MKALLFLAAALGASPELELCRGHLRSDERARFEKAVGPLEQQPLYRAQLSVEPAARTVSGKWVVSYPARGAARSSLLLRLPPNAQQPGRVKVAGARYLSRAAPLVELERSLLRVELEPPVEPGNVALLELELSAKVPAAAASSAMLASSLAANDDDFGAFSSSTEVMSLVGLLPALAPLDENAEPLDGPNGMGDLALFDPASYLVSVDVPKGYRVLAPGMLLGEVPDKGGRVRFTYAATAARDFPLFVTKGYGVTTAKVGEVVIESHYLEEDAEAGKKALEHAKAALGELQRRFGPYPWTNLRLVETRLTGGAGGMEFPGLVALSTALYRGTSDPFAALGAGGLGDALAEAGLGELFSQLQGVLDSTLELTVAHEVAHQYFPMIVGSDPIREPWVDEALAQHAAFVCLEAKHGKQAAEAARKQQLAGAFQLHRLLGGEDGAAARPTSEFSSRLEYGALVYAKAPHFYFEARKLLGEEAFFRGLRAYLEAHRYRWAGDDELLNALAAEKPGSRSELLELRRRWWDQAHGDEDLGRSELLEVLGAGQAFKIDAATQGALEELLRQLSGE